ncbi:MAG: DNA repair and recombination protein RadA [Nanoarchaeota archaeon]|nr:DNA repair and recombination protein RadA [Nanoarchaeota archaeon]
MAKEKDKKAELTDLPGIGPAIAEKLQAAGFLDILSVAVLTIKELEELAGLTEATARKTIQAARKMADLGFKDATEFLKEREEMLYISTGSKNLNLLLGGKGLETGAVTEAYGAYGSGKSQMAHSLAVHAQLPRERGGAEGMVVFIDSEGTFRPERITSIAEALGLDASTALKNIFVARAFNSDHQMLLVEKISELINEKKLPIKLVVIDSLTSHFRAEFSGRGMLADRQQKLNKHIHSLIRLSEQYKVAVYITNQVMANPGVMFGDPTTAIGGHILAHACLTPDTLIQLSDGNIRRISGIKTGEGIIASNFSKLKLENANCDVSFVNQSIKEVLKIYAGSIIKASPLHKFFILKDFGIGEAEAKELKEGDFIAHAKKITIEGEEQQLPKIDGKRLVKISSKGSDLIKKAFAEKKISRKKNHKWLGIEPRQLRRVLNNSYPTGIDTIKTIETRFGLQLLQHIIPVETHKYRNLSIPQVMTPELGQIFGYFLGDGNLGKFGLRFRDERQEVLNEYNTLFSHVFGIHGNITIITNKNCYNLGINSIEIAKLFNETLPDIFDIIGRSKEEVVKAFIKGFSDAEGWISKKECKIRISQKEKEILRYTQLFLLRLGIRSKIYFDVGKKKINHLEITNRDLNDFLQIGFTAADKQKRLFEAVDKNQQKYTKEIIPIERKALWKLLKECKIHPSEAIHSRPKSYKYINRKELEKAVSCLMGRKIEDRQVKQKIEFIIKILNAEIRWEKITKIKREENNQPLFDLSIPKNENYIANGFIVHNSHYRLYLRRGRKGSRVAKMIDAPNLPENEAVFWLTTDGLADAEPKDAKEAKEE